MVKKELNGVRKQMEWMNSELREKGRQLLECLVRTAYWMPSLSAVNVEFLCEDEPRSQDVFEKLFKALWVFGNPDINLTIKVGDDGYHYFLGRTPYYIQGQVLSVTKETILRTKNVEWIPNILREFATVLEKVKWEAKLRESRG